LEKEQHGALRNRSVDRDGGEGNPAAGDRIGPKRSWCFLELGFLAVANQLLMWMMRHRPKKCLTRTAAGRARSLAGGGSSLEWRESAQPALCDITGEGRLQENAARVTCRGIFLLTTAVRQLRHAKHAAQDSYQDGPSFAELSRKILVVRIESREGFTGTWCTTSGIAGDLGYA
jgi:hypothetical protein